MNLHTELKVHSWSDNVSGQHNLTDNFLVEQTLCQQAVFKNFYCVLNPSFHFFVRLRKRDQSHHSTAHVFGHLSGDQLL